MDSSGETQLKIDPRIKLDSEVGIGNDKREPIHIGRFLGIFWDKDHTNRDFALVRLKSWKSGAIPTETLKKVEKYKLEQITRSLVLIPVKYLRLCEKIKEPKKNVKRK